MRTFSRKLFFQILRSTFRHQGEHFVCHTLFGEELADAGSADDFRLSIRTFRCDPVDLYEGDPIARQDPDHGFVIISRHRIERFFPCKAFFNMKKRCDPGGEQGDIELTLDLCGVFAFL